MKRKLLLFLFISVSSSAILQAQISKGDIFLGGSFGVSTYKGDANLTDYDIKGINYNFSPAIGKVIKDNFVFGAELNIAGFDNKHSSAVNHEMFTVGGGVFWRKYFEVLNKFYLFGHGRIAASYAREESDGSGLFSTSKGYGISASIYPGLSYAIKKKIHLEMSLNNLVSASFNHRKITYSSGGVAYDSKINEFGIGSNLFSQSGYAIGIRFLL
jgi:hypothetical protein